MAVSDVQKMDITSIIEECVSTMNNSSVPAIEKATKRLCRFYTELDEDEKPYFLTSLAKNHNVDRTLVKQFAKSFLENIDNGSSTVKVEDKLRSSLTPKYSWLFSQIGKLDGGVKFLVDLRTDILTHQETLANEVTEDVESLKALSNSLRDLLTMWFSVGFLHLERVTWQSSCDMLQKVSEYEAVHPMRNWTDLKRRVGPYRRCFVFTHSTMPREPIVVLHTALTEEILHSIQGIVANPRMYSEADIHASTVTSMGEDPQKITTALFYSITNTLKGLQGIELGNYLIKSVVKELQAEFPAISQFSSLSPIPGLKKWLLTEINQSEKDGDDAIGLLTQEELSSICDHLECDKTNAIVKLKKLLNNNGWIQDEKLTAMLETPLMRLCARYLYLEKRRGYALDGVANFHLKNGASMWRLNWKADLSPRGLGNSCGIMVNFRYFLEATEENSTQYLDTQSIQASEQVLQLARQSWEVSKHKT